MAVLELKRSRGHVRFRVARPAVSGTFRLRTALVFAFLTVAAFVLLCVGVAIGEYPLSLPEVASALFGVGERGTLLVVHGLRLPRLLLGLLAGAAFAMSGAIFQTMTRNPLASPDMIGISAGASTAVVGGIVLGFGAGLGLPTLGLLGGLASALLIYLLAWRRGTTGYRIVLIGIAMSWICVSTTDFLIARAYQWQAHKAVSWLVGNLNDRTWTHIIPLVWAMAVLVPAAILLGRWLRDLQLGDKVATVLGTPVQRARLLLLIVGVGLVSFATSATGPILFVALAAPQIAQRLAGLPWPPLLTSGMTGSVMVLSADLIARQIIPDGSLADVPLPVGIVTAVLAAPVLLWLLIRSNRTGSGG